MQIKKILLTSFCIFNLFSCVVYASEKEANEITEVMAGEVTIESPEKSAENDSFSENTTQQQTGEENATVQTPDSVKNESSCKITFTLDNAKENGQYYLVYEDNELNESYVAELNLKTSNVAEMNIPAGKYNLLEVLPINSKDLIVAPTSLNINKDADIIIYYEGKVPNDKTNYAQKGQQLEQRLAEAKAIEQFPVIKDNSNNAPKINTLSLLIIISIGVIIIGIIVSFVVKKKIRN